MPNPANSEVRLVAMSAEEADELREIAGWIRRNIPSATDAPRKLADRYNDGITEDEAHGLAWAAEHGATDPELSAWPNLSGNVEILRSVATKLRSAFSQHTPTTEEIANGK